MTTQSAPRRGRPALPSDQKLDISARTRLTHAEHAALAQLAHTRGCSVSNLLRHAALTLVTQTA